MKRLILLATMVAVLASCEKHEIRNEVLTAIDFSTNVGKQTKAIVDNTAYLTDQPFGVYAYGHQGSNPATNIMQNVQIGQVDREIAATEGTQTVKKWAATGDTRYYWPNDPNTYINFYAYSPNNGTYNHQKLTFIDGTGNGIAHDETNGMTLTNYKHSNMYVDFMVGTPVKGAKFGDPNGELANPGANETPLTNGTVPVVFNHQLTQLIFKVKTSQPYTGITFTVNSITLNKIHKQGTYTNPNLNSTWSNGSWRTSLIENDNSYNVFPAVKFDATDAPNGAPGIDNNETTFVVDNTEAKTLITTGITVLPQTMETDIQHLTINYTISGTGVATETVTKDVYFIANTTEWAVNQKVTYTITIGLNEIYFAPSVAGWSATDGGNTTIYQ